MLPEGASCLVLVTDQGSEGSARGGPGARLAPQSDGPGPVKWAPLALDPHRGAPAKKASS